MTKIRHKNSKVIFTTALQRQADYICFLAQQISHEVYKRRGFLVLPYLKPGATNTIFFPDLKFPAKFWRQIKKIPRNFGEPFPKFIREIIEKQIVLPENLFQVQKSLEKYWQKSGQKYPQNINVLVTPFGPGSSFYATKKRVSLSFRADRPVFDFNHSLSSALIQTPKPSSADCLSSQKYLLKLGFGKFKKLKDINLNHFSPQEKAVLIELINKNKLTTDEIAKVLWGENEEKYSLWAITKLIQKTRARLKILGADPSQIKTIYGQGYAIYDEIQFEGEKPKPASRDLLP